MFPYACMGLLTIHMWSALCPSLYFSSVASIHLHQCITTLLPLPYLLPYFGNLHMSFHTCTLASNFLCHLFVILNCMSITNNLCFGTHSSFGMTLTLRTFALSFNRPDAYVNNLDSCFMNNVLQSLTPFSNSKLLGPSAFLSPCPKSPYHNYPTLLLSTCLFISPANTTISFWGIQLTKSNQIKSNLLKQKDNMVTNTAKRMIQPTQ